MAYFVATHVFLASAFSANILSSFIGVTLVWFLSIKSLFKVTSKRRRYFLILYWGWQAVSIFFYSKIIQGVDGFMAEYFAGGMWLSYSSITAKIVVTPINLLSNFLFMRWLSGLIKTVIKEA
ncbi:hypothetical protein RCF34_14230 [Pseudomonas sp. 102515]|uniref:hypothetical protein n=1 Tax=Pseudomonas sp. 102515 TaxID=3071568 RepID=UPI00280132A6|nr:hypothetical protein [Pseudomonas sp. 102515]MDQ7914266.1 hypothetical protein [Pseudomonas sp. 102515]